MSRSPDLDSTPHLHIPNPFLLVASHILGTNFPQVMQGNINLSRTSTDFSSHFNLISQSKSISLFFTFRTMAEKASEEPDSANKPIGLNDEARHAASDEKSMSLRQAIRLYPKAVGWSILLSSALIMEGYDLALLGSLYASPEFNRKYGVQNSKTGKWSVPAPWQSAL